MHGVGIDFGKVSIPFPPFRSHYIVVADELVLLQLPNNGRIPRASFRVGKGSF